MKIIKESDITRMIKRNGETTHVRMTHEPTDTTVKHVEAGNTLPHNVRICREKLYFILGTLGYTLEEEALTGKDKLIQDLTDELAVEKAYSTIKVQQNNELTEEIKLLRIALGE